MCVKSFSPKKGPRNFNDQVLAFKAKLQDFYFLFFVFLLLFLLLLGLCCCCCFLLFMFAGYSRCWWWECQTVWASWGRGRACNAGGQTRLSGAHGHKAARVSVIF
ncbi:hypothetical protein ES332_D01G059600v1 [Gossypium tomentosum]|uniref:Uncharacterized protein n=1 Tax=Gossypium tomentosum TaxID=34277 RepID=A0A5D2M5N2_GOSTO|nr:hypothetical protein ES332_D01G059600v1 [Gossypium tomentosum]